MLFQRPGAAVLTLHERHNPGAGRFPPQWRRTVAFDSEAEFAHHHRLHALGIETFFCDIRSPWEKSGVENTIGCMRRVLPRKADLAKLSGSRIVRVAWENNNTQRKCLCYHTPAEIFDSHISTQVLHLKCESTFPLSRELRMALWFT